MLRRSEDPSLGSYRPRVTFIDLSVPIQQPVEGELDGELANALAAAIAYEDHRQSLPIVTRIFGCTEADLPDGQGWANEMVTLSTHAGTHMDAPWHYFPTACCAIGSE
jgi:Putative cyclase